MDDVFDTDAITTLGELSEAIITMRQDYADLDAANVKLGMDFIHARIERDDALKDAKEMKGFWMAAEHKVAALEDEIKRLKEPCIECGGTTGRDCEP